MRRIPSFLLMAALLLAGACDGGGGGGESGLSSASVEVESTVLDSGPAESEDFAKRVVNSRKLVRRARLAVRNQSFVECLGKLEAIVAGAGGFIAESNVNHVRSLRHAAALLRVPAPSFDKVLKQLRGLGDITVDSLSSEDVTNRHIEYSARLRNLERTDKRLLALIDKGGSLEDVLAIEKELQRVREAIEVLTAQVKNLDESVALATIEFSIEEVDVGTEQGDDDIWGSLRELKKNTLPNLKMSFAALIAVLAGLFGVFVLLVPWLVLIVAVIAIVPSWRRGVLQWKGHLSKPPSELAETPADDEPPSP